MTALQQIIKRAKQLRAGNKKMLWKDAVKKASAEYNKSGKKLTGTKKKVGATKLIEKGESRKTPVTKTVRVIRRANGTIETMKRVGSLSMMPLTNLANCLKDIRWCESEIEKTRQTLKRKSLSVAEKHIYNRDLRKLKIMIL